MAGMLKNLSKELVRRIVLVGVLSLTLTACTMTRTEEISTDTICDTQCEVWWSYLDTPETIVQARENNSAYSALCPSNPCRVTPQAVEQVACIQAAKIGGTSPDEC